MAKAARVLAALVAALATEACAAPRGAEGAATVTRSCLGAGSSVSGEVGGQRWTCAGSPYRVTGPITVAHDTVLTVDPGVKVEFQGRHKLTVWGGLHAVGTADQRITWTTSAADLARGRAWVGWRGISWAGESYAEGARVHDHGVGLFHMEYNDVGYVDKTDEPRGDPWELLGVVFLVQPFVSDLVFDHNWLHHSRNFVMRINHGERDPAPEHTPMVLRGNRFSDSVAGLSVAHMRSDVHFVGGGISRISGYEGKAATVLHAYDRPVFLDGFDIQDCGGERTAPWFATDVGGSVTRTAPAR